MPGDPMSKLRHDLSNPLSAILAEAQLLLLNADRYDAETVQGLMAAGGGRHDITAVSLITPELDAGSAERAMREYCREVVLVPARPWRGAQKRMLQAVTRVFEERIGVLRGLIAKKEPES